MSKYQFGSIVNRDFRNTLQRLADDAAAQGKAIQDLVAEGQLTEEQYAELITVINSLVKSGQVDKSDLTPEFKREIEGFDSQLAQTMSQTEFDSWVATLLDGGPSIFYETLSALETDYPNGAAGVALVRETDPARIYVWNPVEGYWQDYGEYQGIELKDNTVTPRTTTFIEQSSNLIDPTKITRGYSVSDAEGLLIENESYVVTDFIKIKNQTVITKDVRKIARYDNNMNYISFIYPEDNAPITFPAITSFVRLVVSNDKYKTARFNEGETLIDEEFYQMFSESITFPKKSITPVQTTFIEKTSNIFNKDDVELGYAMTEGVISEHPERALSRLIEVEPNKTYFTKGPHVVSRLDKEGNYLSNKYVSRSGDTVGSVNARYFRVTVDTSRLDDAYIHLGNEDKGKDLHGNLMQKDILIDERNTTYIESSKNLLDKTKLLDGYGLVEGEIRENERFSLSPFIKVVPHTTYYAKDIYLVARFDKNKNYIGNYYILGHHGQFKSVDAEYVRLTVIRTSKDNAVFNKGLKPIEFKQYGHKLSKDIKISKDNLEFVDEYDTDRFIITGDTEGEITRVEFPSVSNLSKSDQYSSSDFIAMYDSLVGEFPHYVTKTALGTDSLGETIWRYDFKPEPVPRESITNHKIDTSFPKMILASGHHGERTAVYTQYLAMRRICEDWKNDPLLETLRWNVHFVVVPVVNPYGVTNHIRKNENGVDLERNYPVNWELNVQEPDHNEYGGTEPASEPQTKIMMDLYEEEKENLIFFCNFHNFYGTNHFLWMPAGTKYMITLSKSLISMLSRRWKRDYSDLLPQDETSYVGYSSESLKLGGGASDYFARKGIPTTTFEISQYFKYEPNHPSNSSLVFTLGVETLLEFLLLNLKENTKYFNSRKL